MYISPPTENNCESTFGIFRKRIISEPLGRIISRQMRFKRCVLFGFRTATRSISHSTNPCFVCTGGVGAGKGREREGLTPKAYLLWKQRKNSKKNSSRNKYRDKTETAINRFGRFRNSKRIKTWKKRGKAATGEDFRDDPRHFPSLFAFVIFCQRKKSSGILLGDDCYHCHMVLS